MGLFGCSHDWEVIGEKYNPPKDTIEEWRITRSMVQLVERALHGFTVVTQKCKKCNLEDSQIVLGRKI